MKQPLPGWPFSLSSYHHINTWTAVSVCDSAPTWRCDPEFDIMAHQPPFVYPLSWLQDDFTSIHTGFLTVTRTSRTELIFSDRRAARSLKCLPLAAEQQWWAVWMWWQKRNNRNNAHFQKAARPKWNLQYYTGSAVAVTGVTSRSGWLCSWLFMTSIWY